MPSGISLVHPALSTVFGYDAVTEKKAYRRGTHRTQCPQETLERVAPNLKAMGITRVADITGLDCIGVPVTMVVRPNSRSLAVSQGKGLDLVSAQVSGIMESIENYHAEHIRRPLLLGSESTLAPTQQLVDISRLAKSRENVYHKNVRMLWIEGRDLLSGKYRWLPFESVHSDFTIPRPTGSGYFPANTNGLASGNRAIEAVAHALCEVVERDAIALWHQQDNFHKNVVDPASIEDPDIVALLSKLTAANLDVRIWDSTSDIGIACINCLIVGRDKHNADPEFGSGCHPDRRVALMRALTEAVQARTTFIAGSRDDFGFEVYTDEARTERLNACRSLMAGHCNMVDVSAVPSADFDTVGEDMDWILENLVVAGITEVMWIDLSLSEFEIPVARIVVPGLEGAYKGAASDYVPGARAQRVIQA